MQQQQQFIGLELARKQRARSAGSSVVSLAGESKNRFTERHIPNTHVSQSRSERGTGSELPAVQTTMSNDDWFTSLEDEVVPVYTPIPPTDS